MDKDKKDSLKRPWWMSKMVEIFGHFVATMLAHLVEFVGHRILHVVIAVASSLVFVKEMDGEKQPPKAPAVLAPQSRPADLAYPTSRPFVI